MSHGIIVEDCEGCSRIDGRRCIAITSPRAMWRTGDCWARTTDREEVGRAEADIRRYAEKMAPAATGAR